MSCCVCFVLVRKTFLGVHTRSWFSFSLQRLKNFALYILHVATRYCGCGLVLFSLWVSKREGISLGWGGYYKFVANGGPIVREGWL